MDVHTNSQMQTSPLCLQAGDKHIVESVARMQRVIELSRIVRERHGKPLKMPLPSLTVVSADASFLADLGGELRHYVLEEVRVAACHIPLCPRGGVVWYCLSYPATY